MQDPPAAPRAPRNFVRVGGVPYTNKLVHSYS
jgi:hypothetical protein